MTRLSPSLILPLLVAACGTSSSPTAPATLTPVAATVVISNLTASVEAASPGFVYHVAMHVAETGGKSAVTFGSMAFAFPDGRGSIGTLPAAITIPAGTGQDIPTFDVTDPTGTAAEPQISVLLHFADNAGLVGTVTSSAVPVALIHQFTLVGFVRDATTGQGIAGATVQVTSGLDSGLSVTTDPTGYYGFTALRGGTLTLDASASGYVDATRSVTLAANSEVDLTVAPIAASAQSQQVIRSAVPRR